MKISRHKKGNPRGLLEVCGRVKSAAFCLAVILPLFSLMSCGQEEADGKQIISLSQIELDLDEENGEENRKEDINDMQRSAAADRNKAVLEASAGTTITQTIENPAGGTLVIDARVNVDGVSRVSRYRYVPLQFTEEGRKTMFELNFPAETWKVNEATVYNEEKAVWEFVTPRGESWEYGLSDSALPDRQIVNLERTDMMLNYAEENKVSSLHVYHMNEDSIMDERMFAITDSNTAGIEQIGRETIEALAGIDDYICSYLYLCGEDGENPYARAVYRRKLDGMPVTGWHDFCMAYVRKVVPVRVWGSTYEVEEIGLADTILTPVEAVAAMQEQIGSVQIPGEEPAPVTEITLEYLAVISGEGEPEIIPVWRFWLGKDEQERGMMAAGILAVNAVSGDLIWERRAAFVE